MSMVYQVSGIFEQIKVGDIFEVLEVRNDYSLVLKRVYTDTSKEEPPPALGVSVAEDVGTQDKFGR